MLVVPGAQRVSPRSAVRCARRCWSGRRGRKAASFGDFLRSTISAWTPTVLAGRALDHASGPAHPLRCALLPGGLAAGGSGGDLAGRLTDGERITPEEGLRRWEPDGPASSACVAHAGGPGPGKAPRDALPLLEDPEKAPGSCRCASTGGAHRVPAPARDVPLRTPTLPPATHTNCLLLGDAELWVVDPGSPWPEEQAVLRRRSTSWPRRAARRWGCCSRTTTSITRAARRCWACPSRPPRDWRSTSTSKWIASSRTASASRWAPRLARAALPGHARGHLCLIEDGTGAWWRATW